MHNEQCECQPHTICNISLWRLAFSVELEVSEVQSHAECSYSRPCSGSSLSTITTYLYATHIALLKFVEEAVMLRMGTTQWHVTLSDVSRARTCLVTFFLMVREISWAPLIWLIVQLLIRLREGQFRHLSLHCCIYRRKHFLSVNGTVRFDNSKTDNAAFDIKNQLLLFLDKVSIFH